MPTKRQILEHLKADELRALVDDHDLHVDDRRVHVQLVDAVASSRKVSAALALEPLKRERLKEICRALGLDDSGKVKAEIIGRITGERPFQLDLADAETLERALEEVKVPREAPPKSKKAKKQGKAESSGGALGIEQTLFKAADKLRNNMDAAEYKHVEATHVGSRKGGRALS